MFAQLPFETVDHIVGYLDFKDVRTIARVCSAFRLPAQLRLFRAIRTVSDTDQLYHDRIKSILSTPHLLQCVSHLEVQCYDSEQQTSLHSLLPRLPMMSRLRSIDIRLYLAFDDCSRTLSALESLGSEKEITLSFECVLHPNLDIPDNPLPVHSLDLYVDAPNHQVAIELVQKCSQSLHKLFLNLKDGTTLPFPFLPHLCELSIHSTGNDIDLMSWFPFLYQHPTITRISLSGFTLAVQPSPNLLPNLQFLEAAPQIIGQLIPGRPVNHIRATYNHQPADCFLDDIMLRPLRQPFVSVTTLAILTYVYFPDDVLINIHQALPKLRKIIFRWACYEVSDALEGVLTSLGKCTDLSHVELFPSTSRIPPYRVMPLWSRGDFVQMVQRVQENGAAGLWSFELNAAVPFRQEGPMVTCRKGGCEATRVGWLDVPWQPELRGEWQFDIFGSSQDSDEPISS